jgi:hypothetical protein
MAGLRFCAGRVGDMEAMLETGFWIMVAMFAGAEFVVAGKESGVWMQELTRGDSRKAATGRSNSCADKGVGGLCLETAAELSYATGLAAINKG